MKKLSWTETRGMIWLIAIITDPRNKVFFSSFMGHVHPRIFLLPTLGQVTLGAQVCVQECLPQREFTLMTTWPADKRGMLWYSRSLFAEGTWHTHTHVYTNMEELWGEHRLLKDRKLFLHHSVQLQLSAGRVFLGWGNKGHNHTVARPGFIFCLQVTQEDSY